MIRFLKILFLLLFLLVGSVVCLCLVFYYSPGLQRNVAVRVLDAQPGLTTQLDYLRVGLSRTEVRGLKIQSGDEWVSLESLEVRYAIGELTERLPRIKAVTIKGLDLDIAAAGGAQLLGGVSGETSGDQTESPENAGIPQGLPVRIEELDASGFVQLPGKLAFDWRANGSIDEVATLNAVIEGTDLQPWSYQGPALAFLVSPEITLSPETGQITLWMPIRAMGPVQATSATLKASVETNSGGRPMRFTANLSVPEVLLDQWEPVLVAMPQSDTPTERNPAPDSRPPWEGLAGELGIRVDRLEARGNVVTNLQADVRIEENAPVAASVSAMSAGTPLNASAELSFSPERTAMPYSLSGSLEVKGLDVASYLGPVQANQRPILTGLFNVSGNFQSRAPNPGFLADYLTGDFLMESVGTGVFRPLGNKTSLVQGVTGILGSLTGSIRELAWVQLVMDQLKEIPYSRMTFRVSRDADLNFLLRDMDLVSRETRIRGQGIIQFQPGVELLRLPMDMKFQLFAKGRLADALRTGRQLQSEEPDALGFLRGPPLPVRGSLGEPESLLMNLLMDSGTQLLPGLFGQ